MRKKKFVKYDIKVKKKIPIIPTIPKLTLIIEILTILQKKIPLPKTEKKIK